VTELSSLGVIGVPNCKQIAYAGYKDNIEAFLYATAMKTKVSISNTYYPIPLEYIPGAPFNYPRTVFGLAKKTNPDVIDRMLKSLQNEGIKVVQLGKGGQSAYTLEKPSFNTLARILPNIAKPYISTLDGYSQVEHSLSILRVYQALDLFLATNTYSYKREHFETVDATSKDGINSSMELRGKVLHYREGYNKDSKIASELGSDISKRRKIDDYEKHDITDHLDCVLNLGHAVLVAKPSPRTFASSFGPPSSVPATGGCLFPYFPGMLKPDAKFIRDIVGNLFLRNFGTPTTGFKEAYKVFRANFGIAAATVEGAILSHMLLGAKLALETQTQLYILHDGSVYLGYCLLGMEFRVFCNGVWHEPLEEDGLRAELKEIATHDGLVEMLADRLCRCVDTDGDGLVVTKEMIDTPSKLADILVKLDIRETERDEEELARLIGRLTFPGSYKAPTTDNILWAIKMLTVDKSIPLPEGLPIFIPPTGWTGIGTRAYKVLAAFGSTSISFRNAKGDELAIPSGTSDKDPMEARGEDGKRIREFLIVYLKPVKAAVIDWDVLSRTGLIRVDYNERAAGSRGQRMMGEAKEKIWKCLKIAAEAGELRKATDIVTRTAASMAVSAKISMGTKSAEDYF
jgi:hypothetical protein